MQQRILRGRIENLCYSFSGINHKDLVETVSQTSSDKPPPTQIERTIKVLLKYGNIKREASEIGTTQYRGGNYFLQILHYWFG